MLCVGNRLPDRSAEDCMKRAEKSEGGNLLSLQLSQYTLESGESACTCICYKATLALLTAFRNEDPGQIQESRMMGLLSDVLFDGVQLFQKARGEVEHAAVDEVLERVPQLKSELKSIGCGGIQGILQKSSTRPLKDVIGQLVEHRSRNPNEYLAIILTKPPESILIVYPPRASGSPQEVGASGGAHKRPRQEESDMEKGASDGTEGGDKATDDPLSETVAQHCYHLFDSHPRPQLDIHGAYLYSASTEEELLERVGALFPCHDFGANSDDLMSTMYNAFEATGLQLHPAQLEVIEIDDP